MLSKTQLVTVRYLTSGQSMNAVVVMGMKSHVLETGIERWRTIIRRGRGISLVLDDFVTPIFYTVSSVVLESMAVHSASITECSVQ